MEAVVHGVRCIRHVCLIVVCMYIYSAASHAVPVCADWYHALRMIVDCVSALMMPIGDHACMLADPSIHTCCWWLFSGCNEEEKYMLDTKFLTDSY